MPHLTRVLDHLILPACVGCALIATHLLLGQAGPLSLTLVSVPVGILAAVAAILERVRPERRDYRRLDLPLRSEAGHFLLNYQLGYTLALAVCGALGVWLEASASPALWPSSWPMAPQVALALILAEGISYWQHRLFHRIPCLWRFHALHHRGERLNLVRAGRFHAVDVGAGALCVFVPLVLLRAPEATLAWTATVQGVLGVLQHANVRMRTPRWMDRVICTPAVHRHHHSSDIVESDGNFGTTVMIFDRLLGTYREPGAPGPERVGIDDDPVPAGFWPQVFSPFRRRPQESALPGVEPLG